MIDDVLVNNEVSMMTLSILRFIGPTLYMGY